MSNETSNNNDDVFKEKKLTTSDLAEVKDPARRRIEIETGPSVPSNAAGTEAATGAGTAPAKYDGELGPLFSGSEANALRTRWNTIQVAFVDEPRQSVENADRLIAATMQRLAIIFAEERQNLEHQWDRGEPVDTEDLRLSLRRYRSFFSRLLNF